MAVVLWGCLFPQKLPGVRTTHQNRDGCMQHLEQVGLSFLCLQWSMRNRYFLGAKEWFEQDAENRKDPEGAIGSRLGNAPEGSSMDSTILMKKWLSRRH